MRRTQQINIAPLAMLKPADVQKTTDPRYGTKFCDRRLCATYHLYGMDLIIFDGAHIQPLYDEMSRRIFLKLKTASRAFSREMPNIFPSLCLWSINWLGSHPSFITNRIIKEVDIFPAFIRAGNLLSSNLCALIESRFIAII